MQIKHQTNVLNDGAIKEQCFKAANVKKRQYLQLDIKHALEKWFVFGIWCLTSSLSLSSCFLSIETLYNGAPKTIRRVHYFSVEFCLRKKNNNNFIGGVAALLRYLCDGFGSFSYRTCNLHYLIIITMLVFFSRLIYSSIFFTFVFFFFTLSLYFLFRKNSAHSSMFIVFHFGSRGIERRKKCGITKSAQTRDYNGIMKIKTMLHISWHVQKEFAFFHFTRPETTQLHLSTRTVFTTSDYFMRSIFNFK